RLALARAFRFLLAGPLVVGRRLGGSLALALRLRGIVALVVGTAPARGQARQGAQRPLQVELGGAVAGCQRDGVEEGVARSLEIAALEERHAEIVVGVRP